MPIIQGCERVGSAMDLLSTAVLCGYIEFCTITITCQVPGTDWSEPVLAWLTISIPTGSGIINLFSASLLNDLRNPFECGVSENEPTWVFDNGTLEKNGCRIIFFLSDRCEAKQFYSEGNVTKTPRCSPQTSSPQKAVQPPRTSPRNLLHTPSRQ